MVRFDVYEDQAGEWRWRALAGNGRILADSAEGYASERNARRALASFQLALREPATPSTSDRPPVRCRCDKPSLSKVVSNLCTSCGRIR